VAVGDGCGEGKDFVWLRVGSRVPTGVVCGVLALQADADINMRNRTIELKCFCVDVNTLNPLLRI
jgi:hypothetical protein